MFLIVDDNSIHRFNGSKVLIGAAKDCDLRLENGRASNARCCLVRDADGTWRVKNMGQSQVFLNSMPVNDQRPSKIGPADRLTVGDYGIELREVERGGAVARALRAKLFSLQLELHATVLDIVRNNAGALAERDHRKRIEKELDRLLQELELGAELEIHLATQAAQEIISDYVQGFGIKPGTNLRQGDSRKNISRFAGLIPQLLKTIKFDDSETPAQKAERVAVLLPWGIKTRNVIQSWERRELAIGLIREQLLDVIFGLGPLEDLMTAPDTNDIMVLPAGQIFIERNGQIQDTGRRMLSPEVSRNIVERIVAREGRRIDQTSPMVDARMSDGSRLNAIVEPVAVSGPALTIRRFSTHRLGINDLVAKGSLTQTAATFLRACVLARKNIVLAGGTGSGKTTLLNALASFIPSTERIVTVEDTAEIQLGQTHVVTLQARPPNLEGQHGIPIRQLVRNTLRMRPDRILVGECRGGETLDMLQAMNTGHDGSLTTIHANSPADGIRRLEVMAMEAEGIDLPSRVLRELISSSVDVVIHVARFPNGTRRVSAICEVVGLDEESGAIIVEEVYRIRKHKKQGRLTETKLAFTGYVPTFIDDLLRTGVATIDALF
ncbi:MAG TPA: ATPase, T2SS/T4P/T4SS family [Pyrinomonadaceae bacterium]|nr:ATPase, T2SS/T4P/T4SS family [Pyrinomonadaceae bacterium]